MLIIILIERLGATKENINVQMNQKPIHEESKDPVTLSSKKFEKIEEKIHSKDNINDNDSLELKKVSVSS